MPPRPSPPQRLVIVRHGETEWSRTGRHTGRTDIELTEPGRAQARALGPQLAAREFALVLTSPLQRARDTAIEAGIATSVTHVDDDLAEWDYGAYEGITTDAIRAERPGWSLWEDGVVDGESIDDVAGRADRVLERAAGADGDVLLVAHGHILRVLTARWLGQEPQAARLYVLDPATISELGWEREQAALLRWNLR